MELYLVDENPKTEDNPTALTMRIIDNKFLRDTSGVNYYPVRGVPQSSNNDNFASSWHKEVSGLL